MGGEVEQVYQGKNMKKNGGNIDTRHVKWVIFEAEIDNICETDSFESSTISQVSSSSLDLVEDASSLRTPSFGPLYELSDLMNQLPIKRGLSNFYEGKSQSFTSLANAGNIEDLAKKIRPYSHRLKSCKSYAGFDVRKFGPKATITKKSSSKGSFVSSLSSGGNFERQL